LFIYLLASLGSKGVSWSMITLDAKAMWAGVW
jgi:hypothetical protein